MRLSGEREDCQPDAASPGEASNYANRQKSPPASGGARSRSLALSTSPAHSVSLLSSMAPPKYSVRGRGRVPLSKLRSFRLGLCSTPLAKDLVALCVKPLAARDPIAHPRALRTTAVRWREVMMRLRGSCKESCEVHGRGNHAAVVPGKAGAQGRAIRAARARAVYSADYSSDAREFGCRPVWTVSAACLRYGPSVRFLHPMPTGSQQNGDERLACVLPAKAALAWIKLAFLRPLRERNGNRFCGGNCGGPESSGGRQVVSARNPWWARQDSNLQPDRYERPALTIELQAPPRAATTRGPATVPGPFTG